jgi:hypothetical protein
MAVFFIDTESGRVATQRQLTEAGVSSASGVPPRPWHRVHGTGDATTLWYAVMRKRTRGVYIGTLAFRHSDHHASLVNEGWQEVPVDEIA